jgi:hypothetical protein
MSTPRRERAPVADAMNKQTTGRIIDGMPLGWLLVALFFELNYLFFPYSFPFPFRPLLYGWHLLWHWLR